MRIQKRQEEDTNRGWMHVEDSLEILFLFPYKSLSNTEGFAHALMIISPTRPCRELTFVSDLELFSSGPLHCSHKVQPLDHSVWRGIYTFPDTWMMNHPGTTMSIYNIPAIVRDALPMAATPSHTQAGFRCTGPITGKCSAMLISHAIPGISHWSNFHRVNHLLCLRLSNSLASPPYLPLHYLPSHPYLFQHHPTSPYTNIPTLPLSACH